MIEGLDRYIREHPFFAGLAEEYVQLIVGCASNVVFKAGAYLYRHGDPADQFFLLRHGRVALEMSAPGRAPVTFQTLVEGEIIGVTWLLPPHTWSYDARAVDLVRAIAMDAKCLRDKCDSDHDLGYDMMMRFVPVLVNRLQATRMQILDVYATPA